MRASRLAMVVACCGLTIAFGALWADDGTDTSAKAGQPAAADAPQGPSDLAHGATIPDAVAQAQSLESSLDAVAAPKAGDDSLAKTDADPNTREARQELAAAQQMANSALAALKSSSTSTALAATESTDDRKAELAELDKVEKLLQAASSLQTSTPSEAPASPVRAESSAKSDATSATAEEQQELAQAQAMADAALTDSSSVASTAASSTADSASDSLSTKSSSKAGNTHQGMQALVNPSLAPDSGDSKHHTMGSLF